MVIILGFNRKEVIQILGYTKKTNSFNSLTKNQQIGEIKTSILDGKCRVTQKLSFICVLIGPGAIFQTVHIKLYKNIERKNPLPYKVAIHFANNYFKIYNSHFMDYFIGNRILAFLSKSQKKNLDVKKLLNLKEECYIDVYDLFPYEKSNGFSFYNKKIDCLKSRYNFLTIFPKKSKSSIFLIFRIF